MKTIYRFFAGMVSAGTMALLAFALYLQTALPNSFYVAQGETLTFSPHQRYITCSVEEGGFPVEAYSSAGNSYTMHLKLLGAINIKEVDVQVVDRPVVTVCGNPFGIKMFTQGVMVVGLGPVQTASAAVSPAKEAGIQQGDVILSLNGETNLSNQSIAKLVNQYGERKIAVKVSRGGRVMEFSVTPALAITDQKYHIGLWVRDSSAGIGTMTFYDPATDRFAGLGHAVCDVDTGQILPLSQGQIVHASITGITPGKAGNPGELQGTFTDSEVWGNIDRNNQSGVFGRFHASPAAGISMPIAMCYEIQPGPAEIYTTVYGQQPQRFSAVIEKVNTQQQEPGRNMVLHITDPQLLATSGGIVQGMSGSPICQNGKLVGAVTHVFVNDPTRGYGIFIENMLEAAE